MHGDGLVFNRNNPVTDLVEVVSGNPDTPAVVRKCLNGDGEIVVPHWVSSDEPVHWNHWRREDLAYTSGLCDAFAAEGLRAPQLLGRVEPTPRHVELTLELVQGRTGAELSLSDHVRANRALGAAQARLADHPDDWLDLPWLSRRWLRAYATTRPGLELYAQPQRWEHPVVVDGLGDRRHDLRLAFGDVLAALDSWLDLMERLPRTLCHLDHWPNNLIAAEGGDVLIDWSFVGEGAVGEDPGNWVPDTIFDFFVDAERFEELDQAVWGAYRDGLVEAGWTQPVELARLAMCASAVKYVWLPALMVKNVDNGVATGYGGQPGPPLAEVFRRRGIVWEHLLGWLDEARELRVALGLY